MTGFNKDFNLVPFIGLVVTVATVLWFAFQKIDAGYTYTLLFLVPMALLFAAFLFVDENSKSSIISRLKIPFTSSTVGGAALLLLGQLIYIAFEIPGRLLFPASDASQGFSFTNFNVPLAAQQTNILIEQTAAQLSIVTSKAAQLFITVEVASFIEEFIFRFVVIFISYMLVMFVMQAIFNKKPSHSIVLLFSFIITGITFAFVHRLNGTYNAPSMYVIAAVFSLLLSASIYYAGAFISFTIGFHQANNFIWFVHTYGWKITIQALMSPLGLVMIAIEALMIIIVLNNLKPANKFVATVISILKRSVKV